MFTCLLFFRSKSFQWSESHDIILCREILVSEPYYFKPRSPERGKAWEKIANNLNSIHDPKFRVTTRFVRDRYTILATKQAQKLKMEERATGIEVEQTESDVLLEEILEKEKLGKEQIELDLGEKKRKAEKEKMTAENMREQAMKRMEEKSKRKSEDTDADEVGSSKMKRARRGVGDVVGYLQEKATKEYSLKVEELEIRKKELETAAEREKAKSEHQEKLSQQQQDTMLSLVNQMQQQQQHQQNMQAMLVAQQQQQNQMLMSIMGKLAER